MDIKEAAEFLAGIVEKYPFPDNAYEAGYLRKHLVRYGESCDIIAANCKPEGRLLSIGSEPGHIELLLGRFYGFKNITGLTYRASPEFKRRMAAFGIEMAECDVESEPIPGADAAFDSIVFLEALEHMFLGVPFALKELRRVLKQGGTMVLSTPNQAQFRNRIKLMQGKSINWPLDGEKKFFKKPVHARHNREYTAKEVAYLLKEAGFENRKTIYREFSPGAMMRFFNTLAPSFKSTMFFIAG